MPTYIPNYLINTKKITIIGPCNYELSNCRGTPCFMKSLEALEVQCTCLPKIATTENGRCYQPYTRGPCEWELLSIYSNSSPNMIFVARKKSCYASFI